MEGLMSPFKVGIIGAGRIAGGFDDPRTVRKDQVFTHAGAFSLHPDFEIDSIYDPDKTTACNFAKRWQIPNTFAQNEWEEFFKRPFDVVCVCSPDETHYDVILRILDHPTVRMIFAEKPLAQTAKEIESILQRAQQVNKEILVNFQRSFDPTLKNLAEEIKKSEVLLARACYYKGLSHIGSTMLYLLIEFFGKPHAITTTARAENRQIKEPSYDFSMHYKQGFEVTVNTLDRGHKDYYFHIFDFEIFLPDRKIICHSNSRFLTTFSVGNYPYGEVIILRENEPKIEPTNYDASFFLAADTIAKKLRNAAPAHLESVQRSLEVRHLIDAIEHSFNTRSTVHV